MYKRQQLDITGLGANAGNNYAPVGTLLEKLFTAGGYDSTSPQPPGSGNPSSPFYNSSIAARAQGVIARIRTLDYGSTGGFSIPSIDIQSQINFTPVDQTITAAQRTIASVTTYQQDNTLGTTTKLTMSAAHFYETGQAIVVSGTTFSGGIGTIDGNYTVQGAEFPAESPNYVSITIDYNSQASGLLGGNYNASSGTAERTPVVGSSNKQVVENITNPSGVTGTITFAPTTKILQFGVNSGAWEFDREIT